MAHDTEPNGGIPSDELLREEAVDLPPRRALSILDGLGGTSGLLGAAPGTTDASGVGAPDSSGLTGGLPATSGMAPHLPSISTPPQTGPYNPDITTSSSTT